LLSAAEFVFGAAVVIGHNVFHVLPNEVPILFVVGVLSLRLRSGTWASIGLSRPPSWKRVVLIAIGAAVLRLVLGGAVESLAAQIWPAPIKAARGVNEIAGHPWIALKWLGIVWTFAAFGEEVSYRAYLVTRAADLGNRSRLAYGLAVIAVAVLFGLGHYYKGPAGVLDSAVAGLILGAAYLMARRNLWACVLAHGLIDTVGVVAAYFG
jgi:membrane protease YdiL (CAAX protease family)